MILTTVTLAAMLASGPHHNSSQTVGIHAVRHFGVPVQMSEQSFSERSYAIDLHPMTEEEKRVFPGRDRWDKTEWYEAQFKSAKVVTAPEHVEEWHNGGTEQA